MRDGEPHLSIGLPVFNGDKYLEDAIDSILAQTYTDFELIISDNASTDNTPRICRAFEAKDRRIHYYHNERHTGAYNNFNHVFRMSSGEYFKWAAHDDVLAPEFLERCVGVLDQDSSVVLCYSKTRYIDEEGAVLMRYDNKMRLGSKRPSERFGDIINCFAAPGVVYGVTRASALRMTPLIQAFIGSDRTLFAEISLMGRMHKIPEYLFFRREHLGAFTSRGYSPADEEIWWTNAQRYDFRYWNHIRMYLEYFKSVGRVPLKWSDRYLCFAEIGKFLVRKGWIDVGADLNSIFRYLLCRSRLGRKFASVSDRVLRKTIDRVRARKKFQLGS